MSSQEAGSGAWLNVGAVSAQVPAGLPDDIINFYPDAGLDTIAREAGVIEVEVATQESVPVVQPQKNKTIKIIAMSVPQKHQFGAQGATQQPQFYLASSPQVVNDMRNQNTTKIYQLVSPSKTSNQTWAVPAIKKKPAEELEYYLQDNKRRKGGHSGKGLRHFSMKVCEKVQRKQITSYNEVADELVSEIFETSNGDVSDQSFDQKNIRRRVYDALNVLMAMNIISKEKKEIKWIGLPTNSDQECQHLESEKREIVDRLKTKSQQLKELILQQIAFKQLIERNRKLSQTQGFPSPNSTIQLPFILLTTSKKTVIDCSISNDKYEFLFNFDQIFSIHDDIEVLKRMGLALNLDKGTTSDEDLKKCCKMVPAAVHGILHEMANRGKFIKIEPCTSSSGYNADESMDGEMAWGGSMVTDASRQSSCASRSDQPSPDFTDSVDSE